MFYTKCTLIQIHHRHLHISSTIDAKTIQGYPFPTIDSNQEWNWPGKNN